MNENESVGLLIKKIHDATGSIVNTEMKELDLTMSQSHMLYFLYHRKGQNVSVKEVENYFCIKHTTAIGIINRLENKGFVTSYSSLNDKRIRNIEITKEGEQKHEWILSKFDNLEQKFLNGLTPTEVNHLKNMLTIINTNLQGLK
ncbi:MarR family winged helix-turn-helix transcriptional regulator [Anaerovorax odorimutans]|uniref:MarR family winged helix-turn-helix transcriptional regulator n=1 Tax=Anaerovorax odorimutans TaxID=109327 RepID=UPI000419AF06|nr:MarR family transcriptional regulator [Anaerovorax odorimutans]